MINVIYTMMLFLLFQSRDALAVGDMARAHSSANSARTMIRISYGVGIASFVIAAVIVIVYVGIITSLYN